MPDRTPAAAPTLAPDRVEALVRAVVKQLTAPDPGPATLVLARDRSRVSRNCLDRLDRTGARLCFLGQARETERFDSYILPCLSCNQMADLAMGKGIGKTGRAVLSLLLAGKTVHVAEYEYKAHGQTAPEALLRHYEGLEASLAGFGLRPWKPGVGRTQRLRDRLITLEKLRRLAPDQGAGVEIPADARVTPLAMEFTIDNQIRLIRR